MNIYEELKKDHEEVKTLLSELVSLKEDDDYRYILVEEIGNLVIPHSRAEESVFYNTLRAVDADKKVVFHGYKEHMEAETLLRTLQVMDKLDLTWKPVAIKLQDAIEHHIQEEENEIFTEARNILTEEEAVAIGDAFLDLKPKVREESFMKQSLDMVVNLMPPRLADSIRKLGSSTSV